MKSLVSARAALAALVVLLATNGCSAPRFDGSSEQAFTASAESVKKSLSPEEQAKLAEALMVVGMQGTTIFESALSGKSPESFASEMRSRVSGKTGAEVIAEADRIQAERAARERAEAEAELAKLEAAEKAVLGVQADLAKFEILEARLGKTEGFMPRPFINMKVRNGTTFAVRRGYFRGRVTSPGRSVAWIEDDFNYQVSGGIEPGEEQVWRLSPNMFSGWSTDVPMDAALKVAVVKLEGADGKPLFTELEFAERDAARVASLRKMLGR